MNRWLIFIIFSFNIVIAFYFWRYWKLVREVKEIQIARQHRPQSNEFIATNEWQKITRDQSIPRGLHVRINLQTGEREAKLMSSESGKENSDETSIVMLDDLPKNDDSNEHNLKIQLLKESLKYIPNEINQSEEIDENDVQKESLRTYEELKKDMFELKLDIKTDAEIMNELFHRFNSIQKEMKVSDAQKEIEILAILKDFEYLLHQVDNAEEFAKLNGISNIIAPCLTSNSTFSRTLAARVLGSAVQNNAKVQIAALKAGVITPLLRNIALERGYEIRSSSLYALSCLVRTFPLAEVRLIEEGGLSVLLSFFDEDLADSFKLQLKVITFFDDLLLEREDAERDVKEERLLPNVTDEIAKEEIKIMIEKQRQYNNVGLASKLVERGWCVKLPQVLIRKFFKSNFDYVVNDDTVNHDLVDKASKAMLTVFNHCENHFKVDDRLHSVLKTLFNYYKNLSKTDDDDNLYKDVSGTLDELCTKLKIM